MGCFTSKEPSIFAKFTCAVKEEIKRKSVYQYQITHFKMLNVEKKSLPSTQAITSTKIMKIKNLKRLEELKRIWKSIPLKDSDLISVYKLKQAEKSIEKALFQIKLEVERLAKEEMSFLELKSRLKKLITLKSLMEQQNQEISLIVQKKEFTRRFSMNLIQTSVTQRLRGKNREFTKKGINMRMINCIRRIKRVEQIVENAKNSNLFSFENKKAALESKILMLKQEKEDIIILNHLDAIEKTFETSSAEMSKEVKFIRLEYEKVSRLNEILMFEVNELKRANK